MENVLEIYENDKYLLKIVGDDSPENPREFLESIGRMVTVRNTRYNLGDFQVENPIEFICEELDIDTVEEIYDEDSKTSCYEEKDMEVIMNEISEKAFIYPLYLYDHSGLSLTIGSPSIACRWDTSKVGYIYCSIEDARDNLIVNENETLRECVEKILKSEVKIYSEYLDGDSVGYTLESKVTCSACNHIHYELIDSCFNFYGTDYEENGLFECINLTADEKADLLSKQVDVA